MKPFSVLLAALTLLTTAAGCAGTGGASSASRSLNSPEGTEVGTSFPGVNQPTTTTEAARSNNAADNVPNSRR